MGAIVSLRRLSAMVFTALHGMQMRSSDDNSVRLSVKRLNCDKTVGSVQITYEKSFSLVF